MPLDLYSAEFVQLLDLISAMFEWGHITRSDTAALCRALSSFVELCRAL